MSDTTPNTERPTDPSNEQEPAAVRYEPGLDEGASESPDEALGDHSNGGAVTAEEVLADPPVTAEPPAIDGEVSDDDVPTSTLADGNVAHTNPVYVERDESDERDRDERDRDERDRDGDQRDERDRDQSETVPLDDTAQRNDEHDSRQNDASVAAVPVVADEQLSADRYRPSEPASAATTASAVSDEYRPGDRYQPGEPAREPAPAPTAQYPAYQPVAQSPIYVQAPFPPKKQGNRGVGILIGLLATVVYALIYAGVVFLIAAATSTAASAVVTNFTDYLVRPVYYVPVIFFFLAFTVLVAIVNRGGWWAYVLFGFLVAVVVYFSYIGGALLTVQAWNFTPQQAVNFLSTRWLDPGAIAAAVVAREVPIWAGAWIARRGRAVTARNAEARSEYERRLAAGPQLRQPA